MSEHEIRHYILSFWLAFRGWKLLPYAISHRFSLQTEFYRKEQWDLIRACDGKTDIVWDELTDEQRAAYEEWEKNGVIHLAGDGESLLKEQEYRFYPSRFKEKVQWSVTGRCNYKCRHCFMSAPHAAQGEPSWDELMTMLDAFERCGIKGINLTGGEPAVRSDFWQLVDEILSRGMIIPVIFSNGLLITDAFLDKLEARHIYPTIQLSFDGVGWHDWLKGIPGAEKIALDAFRRCHERGFPTAASMVLFRENKDSIRETANLLASLGVGSLKTDRTVEQGEWNRYKDHTLTLTELFETYLEYIPHYFEDGMPLTLSLDAFFIYDKQEKKMFSAYEKNIPEEYFGKVLMCGHVRRELYVSPKGGVLPCMSMVESAIEEQFPNMLETPLEEILDKGSLQAPVFCICLPVRDMKRTPAGIMQAAGFHNGLTVPEDTSVLTADP